MRDAAFASGWLKHAVLAFDYLETAHARAGTTAAHHRALDAQIAQLPPDTPHWVRACFGYARARSFIGTARTADAVPAFEQLIAEERPGGVPAEHWHWLAQAYLAAGRLDDAVDAAGIDADWLDTLQERGRSARWATRTASCSSSATGGSATPKASWSSWRSWPATPANATTRTCRPTCTHRTIRSVSRWRRPPRRHG
ncbi:hypothetical protein BJF90_09010 [Pseudonocardia sp. CNS-004]|nr:hypothetical protein BJF90_09010 [Pseudonocardia sp. CNS-004]